MISPSASGLFVTYFVAGGTVPPDAPSYVERGADQELLKALLAGEYCYVLNSRQMGKSSLAVRTIAKLAEVGVRTAFIDLTKLGAAGVTEEQWSVGLVAEVGRALGIRSQAMAFLRENAAFGPGQRLLAFLQDIVARLEGPTVVMIDEIDAVRSLPFSTDAFFAGIRQLHNGRASDSALRNLTFCLLGAALPGDLIRDARVTPFNVGRRIELRDFTEAEVLRFGEALGPNGPAIARSVYVWTGGHPFLTQSLCAAMAEGGDVDALVRARYLDARARDADSNLADVGNRLLGKGDPDVGEKEISDTLSLYAKLLKSGIPDDEANPSAARIKMSGVARLEGGRLTVRNRIYAQVFGPAWVRENMPGQEVRRQRRAFWKGALRTGAVAAIVIGAISTLAIIAVGERNRAESLRKKAEYDTYVATMRTMPLPLAQHNADAIHAALLEQKDNPARGWEWKFWNHVANRGTRVSLHGPNPQNDLAVSPDGRELVLTDGQGLAVIDLQRGEIVRRLGQNLAPADVVWFRDGRRLLVSSSERGILVLDAQTGRELRQEKEESLWLNASSRPILPGDRRALATANNRIVSLDLRTLRSRTMPMAKGRFAGPNVVSPSGDRFYTIELDVDRNRGFLVIRDVAAWKVLGEIPISPLCRSLSVTPDGRRAAVGTELGELLLIDLVRKSVSSRHKLFRNALYGLRADAKGDRLLAYGFEREGRLFKWTETGISPLDSFNDTGVATITPDGRVLAEYNDLMIYKAASEPGVPSVATAELAAAVITKDGILYTGSTKGVGRVDLLDPKSRWQSLRKAGNFCDPAGPGYYLNVRFQDRTSVIDLRSGTEICRISGSMAGNWPVCSDRTGAFVAWGDDRQKIHIYDVAKRRTTRSLPAPRPVNHIEFSPDLRSILIGGADGSLALRSIVDDGTLWDTGPVRSSAILEAEFSPDGRRLATVGQDDVGAVWDATTGRQLARLVGHSQSVLAIAWSPDGTRIATGSEDRTVRIWDPATGRELGTLGQHEGRVRTVGFLPGGRTLASVGADGTVKLWMTEAKR